MTVPANADEHGSIYTFYSFKGGVGRTMALANVAALLARWGHSVLVVDWDLEAPGLERFFARVKPDIQDLRAKTPGIVDLVRASSDGERMSWRDCLLNVEFNGNSSRLSIITAGRSGPDYTSRLQSLSFSELFEKQGLGSYIEELRNQWISEFEFVLVDSRTGVTDIGGICTVHLADVLVLLFTTTESSMDGAMQIVERARKAQELLPLDRRRLLAVPVPARDESRTEFERATDWKNRFAERFKELYRDWLPSGKTAHDAIELLRIPYVPYWSFGEPLPVIEEGTSDPASIGHAYEILARILATRLDWYAALKGQTLAPPPTPKRREIDREWLTRHGAAARQALSETGLVGYMEIYHFSPDSDIAKTQLELRPAATHAQVHTTGWPIGVVLNNREEYRPSATNEGILATVSVGTADSPARHFDYWTLSKSGDFYTLLSLFEDRRDITALYFDTRIARATEALIHCANLYKFLGVDPNAQIEVAVRYGGLQGRKLSASSPEPSYLPRINLRENEVSIAPITFRLADIDNEIVELVKHLCEPLFVVFDFGRFDDEIYQQIVTDFVKGKAT